MPQVLDGVAIAAEIKQEVVVAVTALAAQGIRPGLAVILVGNVAASEIYVRSKVKTSGELGIYSEMLTPPENVTTEELLAMVAALNARDEIDGILIQLPLPAHVDTKRLLEAVAPEKDVDGFHPVNVGRLVSGQPGLQPCTPAGVMEMLRRRNIPVAGGRAGLQTGLPAYQATHVHGVPLAHSGPGRAHTPRRHPGGRHRPRRLRHRRHGETRRRGHRCGYQSHHRRAQVCRVLRGRSRPPRHVYEARVGRGGRCAPGCLRGQLRIHTRTRRRRRAHHRHADVEHCEGRQAAPGTVMPGLRVGLTGGLGSGKSTVAAMLAARGAHVLYADELARELMQPGQAVYAQIVAAFGSVVVRVDGTLDRAALARIAFTEGRIEDLNRIVHPATIARQAELAAAIFTQQPDAVVVVESALILETKYGEEKHGEMNVDEPQADAQPWRTRFDRLLLITAPDATKIARFIARSAGGVPGGLAAEARRRLAQMIPDADKLTRVDRVIHNDGTLSELEDQVDAAWVWLQSGAQRKADAESRQA
jgi:dephospho-CoA kinase